MGNIIAGLVLIGIGLAIGDSVFQGRIGLTSLIFDGLGTYWVIKGAYGLYQARREGV